MGLHITSVWGALRAIIVSTLSSGYHGSGNIGASAFASKPSALRVRYANLVPSLISSLTTVTILSVRSIRHRPALKASASRTGLVGSWTIRFARIAPDHTIHALMDNGNFLSFLGALRAMVYKPFGLLSAGSIRPSSRTLFPKLRRFTYSASSDREGALPFKLRFVP